MATDAIKCLEEAKKDEQQLQERRRKMVEVADKKLAQKREQQAFMDRRMATLRAKLTADADTHAKAVIDVSEKIVPFVDFCCKQNHWRNTAQNFQEDSREKLWNNNTCNIIIITTSAP